MFASRKIRKIPDCSSPLVSSVFISFCDSWCVPADFLFSFLFRALSTPFFSSRSVPSVFFFPFSFLPFFSFHFLQPPSWWPTISSLRANAAAEPGLNSCHGQPHSRGQNYCPGKASRESATAAGRAGSGAGVAHPTAPGSGGQKFNPRLKGMTCSTCARRWRRRRFPKRDRRVATETHDAPDRV